MPEGLDVLDQAGAPAGKDACVGPVQVGPASGAVDPAVLAIPVAAQAEVGALRFLGYGLEPAAALPGAFVEVRLFWQVRERPAPGLALWLAWVQGGEVLAQEARPLAGLGRDAADWPPGHAFRTRHLVRVPLHAREGEVLLQAEVGREGLETLGAPLDLGAVQVLPVQRTFALPAPRVPQRAQFGEGILLLGADLPRDPVRPGDSNPVTLYWQATAEMERSYTGFLHLLDAEGRVRAGVDRVPGEGARPTNTWLPPEVLAESFTLAAPEEPGTYWLEVGWYDAARPGMPRLPATDAKGNPLGDRLLLGPVEVAP
ncbi:MAG: hypothetical protein H5T59_14975 [Anaerolineae bacterium]|nr:hypothetical protein [Anaerolineae bacterium]